MTRILLDIPHDKDLNLILALLNRLDVRIVTKTSAINQPIIAEDELTFIMKGLPTREDFTSFLDDFELSRKRDH